MAGQVFGNGNGHLGAEVCNEVICRNEARSKGKGIRCCVKEENEVAGINITRKSDLKQDEGQKF